MTSEQKMIKASGNPSWADRAVITRILREGGYELVEERFAISVPAEGVYFVFDHQGALVSAGTT